MKQSEIKRLTSKSRQTISKVINGRIEKVSPETARKILGLWEFENNLKDLFTDDLFLDCMNLAIRHAPKNKHGDLIRTFAVLTKEASFLTKTNIKNAVSES